MRTPPASLRRQVVEEAANAIIADLSAPIGQLPLTMSYRIEELRTDFVIEFLVGSVGMTVPIDKTLAPDMRIVAIQFVDLLQDTVVEETYEARPRCPIHSDLLIADYVDSVPMWTCSRSGDLQIPFGKYHALSERWPSS